MINTVKRTLVYAAISVLFISACGKGDAKNNQNPDDPAQQPGEEPIPYNTLPQTVSEFSLTASANEVNVMGNNMPVIQSFATVTKKSSLVRGYVKDTWGRPVAGAYIGVRSSVVGGQYTMASATTDAKGYYQVEPPLGVVEIWAAGVSLPYGEGFAAQGLYAADGTLTTFASQEGAVENFVLLPYGKTNAMAASERPWYSRNYFGGTIRFNYSIYEDRWSETGSLPADGEIEIKLEPDELLLDARERKTFIIRKKVGGLGFYVNNIPAGRYTITSKLVGGTNLRMRSDALTRHAIFGLKPDDATGSGKVMFIPHSTEASFGAPNLGGWNDVHIKLQLPQ